MAGTSPAMTTWIRAIPRPADLTHCGSARDPRRPRHGSPHPPHRALRQGHQGHRRFLREGVRAQAHADPRRQDRVELLHERRRGQSRAAAVQERGRRRRAQGLRRHPPFRLPVRRPAGAAEEGRSGRRRVLLRSRRARGRRLRAQVQGPQRHRLRPQLERLATHARQDQERRRRLAAAKPAAARRKPAAARKKVAAVRKTVSKRSKRGPRWRARRGRERA